MSAGPAVIGFERRLLGRRFRRPLGDPDSLTVPRIYRFGLICSSVLSSSKLLRLASRSLLVRATTPAGVSSLFAAPLASSTPPFGWGPLTGCGRSQSPASFRPRVFATPRRFSPSPTSRACLIPQPRTGFSHAVQGVLPFRSGLQLVAGPCPHVVGRCALTGDPAAIRTSLDFEASFRGAMRSSGSGFSLPLRRSPLRLSPPAGPRSSTVDPVPRDIRSWRCRGGLLRVAFRSREAGTRTWPLDSSSAYCR